MNSMIMAAYRLFVMVRTAVKNCIFRLFPCRNSLPRLKSDVCSLRRAVDSCEAKADSALELLKEVRGELKILSGLHTNLGGCVSEMGYSVSCIESMVYELNSGLEGILKTSFESDTFPDGLIRDRSRLLFDDAGVLWSRLRDVRNYLSDLLLNYNERIRSVELSQAQLRQCERLAEMVSVLFQEDMKDVIELEDYIQEYAAQEGDCCITRTEDELPF
ncbi:MAG: hypothetical protein ABS939_20910 [Psychrobacillus sp.]